MSQERRPSSCWLWGRGGADREPAGHGGGLPSRAEAGPEVWQLYGNFENPANPAAHRPPARRSGRTPTGRWTSSWPGRLWLAPSPRSGRYLKSAGRTYRSWQWNPPPPRAQRWNAGSPTPSGHRGRLHPQALDTGIWRDHRVEDRTLAMGGRLGRWKGAGWHLLPAQRSGRSAAKARQPGEPGARPSWPPAPLTPESTILSTPCTRMALSCPGRQTLCSGSHETLCPLPLPLWFFCPSPYKIHIFLLSCHWGG